MNTPNDVPLTDRVLRQHDHWARHAWPLAILATGLATMLGISWRRHPSLARVEQWGDLPRWWAAGVALTFLAAAGVWLWRRGAGMRTARRLDHRLDAKNRLETAAILRGDAGAMARAQREEAAAFLEEKHVAPRREWLLLSLEALAAVLILAHLGTLLSWTRPWIMPAVAVSPSSSRHRPFRLRRAFSGRHPPRRSRRRRWRKSRCKPSHRRPVGCATWCWRCPSMASRA